MTSSTLAAERRQKLTDTEPIPPPSHRHASPSGPWPWMDLESDSEFQSTDEALPKGRTLSCPHTDLECPWCWPNYPQSLFPNWKLRQVERSEIKEICARSRTPCVIHHVDIGDDANFSDGKTYTMLEQEADKFRDVVQKAKRPDNNRVRTLFVESISMPMLRMLGTKYNIEPFFFTSSLNWIPSQYQENSQPEQGDHITITLTFLRAEKIGTGAPSSSSRTSSIGTSVPGAIDEVINTQLPLSLKSHALRLNLLAIHMIRTTGSSTIISYHPDSTPAKYLHSRVLLAGESVYWHNIFQKSNDPTFVLLVILWYALYAWDQALETLWEHIGQLELAVMKTNNMGFTQELHKIRAHLLHYTSLLDDFHASVQFVLDTHNPAMDAPAHSFNRDTSRELLEKECANLLMQIRRLQMSRGQQDKRLKNVMNLVFSRVNIDDSKRMKELTEAAVRDSAAMKQVAYLTMIFLPASFVAGVFGMNIREINPQSSTSLAHYFETATPLTVVTIWIIVAFHGKWTSEEGNREGSVQPLPRRLRAMGKRLEWPILIVGRFFTRRDDGESQTIVEKQTGAGSRNDGGV